MGMIRFLMLSGIYRRQRKAA